MRAFRRSSWTAVGWIAETRAVFGACALVALAAACAASRYDGANVVVAGWDAQTSLREVAAVLDSEGFAVVACDAQEGVVTQWDEEAPAFFRAQMRRRVRVRAIPEGTATRLVVRGEVQENRARNTEELAGTPKWRDTGRDEVLEQRVVWALERRFGAPPAWDDPVRARPPELTPR